MISFELKRCLLNFEVATGFLVEALNNSKRDATTIQRDIGVVKIHDEKTELTEEELGQIVDKLQTTLVPLETALVASTNITDAEYLEMADWLCGSGSAVDDLLDNGLYAADLVLRMRNNESGFPPKLATEDGFNPA